MSYSLFANSHIWKHHIYEIDLKFSVFLPPEPNRLDLVASGNYQAVSFSYGNTDASSEAKNFDSGLGYSGFHPPFPVPESLLKNLVSTYMCLLSGRYYLSLLLLHITWTTLFVDCY